VWPAEVNKLTSSTVIARQALAQEDVGDFSNDFPDTIPIDLKGNESGCAC
jgi:Ras-related protein Rab-7A